LRWPAIVQGASRRDFRYKRLTEMDGVQADMRFFKCWP
jgi:hypothetical protein